MSKYEKWCEDRAVFFGSITLALIRDSRSRLDGIATVAIHFARLAKQPTEEDLKEEGKRRSRVWARAHRRPKIIGPITVRRNWKFKGTHERRPRRR